MATLDELLNIEGVVAAGEFDPDGSLVDYKATMDMSPEMAQMTAQFCATVTMMFNTLANSYTQLSGMRWVPQQGWAYSGGDWTVAVGGGGYKGVFVETAKADFNKLFEALVESDVSSRTEPTGASPVAEEVPPTRTEGGPLGEEGVTGAVPLRAEEETPPTRVEEVPPTVEEPPPRTGEASPLERERAGQPERGQEEDRGLLDRAREALFGPEEEEPRRREEPERREPPHGPRRDEPPR
jgi:roadblock/LC7 domain-containing protein